MKSKPRSEPCPGCPAHELSGTSGTWVELEGEEAAEFWALVGRQLRCCLLIHGLSNQASDRPHSGSLNSWLDCVLSFWLFPGSTWRRGKVAVWFPVWPSGQVASGARCPSALWGLLCFLPVVCVSISPPRTPPHPPNASGAEMRDSCDVELARRAGSFPGKAQESPGYLLSLVVGQTREAGPCPVESWAMHPGSRPLRGRGGFLHFSVLNRKWRV